MPAYNNNFIKKTYYSVTSDSKTKRAHFRHKTGTNDNGTPIYEIFEILAGYLIDIQTTEGEYKGQPTYNIEFHLKAQNGDIDVLQMGRYTNQAKSLLLRLANIPNDEYGWVRLYPTVTTSNDGKDFIHISVRHIEIYDKVIDQNTKLKIEPKYQSSEIPKIEKVKITMPSGQVEEHKDRGAYLKFIDNLIAECTAKLPMSVPEVVDEEDDAPGF